jgi:DNA helicase-2/ATP-dependent DNA helicase PcrA
VADSSPFPGPKALGRGAVVLSDAAVPAGLSGATRIVVDGSVLDDPKDAVEALHRAWVSRQPVVIVLAVDQAALAEPVVEKRPPFDLGGRYDLARERLHFLVWANTYDCRTAEPVWWHARKAASVGAVATPDGPADATLPDGTAAWIDAGPRHPLPKMGYPVIHRETVELGGLARVPHPMAVVGDLAPDQLAAVGHLAGPARVIAPAGSGKTRTLTARIRHLVDSVGVEPELMTVVAYNNRAAAELRSRLGPSAVSLRTIHSLGWWILRQQRPGVKLLDERDVRSLVGPLAPVGPLTNQDPLAAYLEALSEVRIALRPPQLVEDDRDDVPGFADLYPEYRRRLLAGGVADFDEQVFGAIEVLLAEPALRRRVQARCRHLLVDEFQDLTPAYLLLLRLVASPGLVVFGVGDDDQVIYGYAGADPGFLIDFDRLFPGAGHHPLEINYRCPTPVVEAASNLLTRNRRRVPKTVRPPEGRHDPDDRLAVRTVRASSLGVEAAAEVARWLEERAQPAQMAVLCRVNDGLLPAQAALAEIGVPYVSTVDAAVLQRTGMRAALAYLRLTLHPDSMARADLLEAVKRPWRGLNQVAVNILQRRRTWQIEQLWDLAATLDDRKAAKWDEFVADLDRLAKAVARGASTQALLGLVRRDAGLDKATALLDASRGAADRAGHGDDLDALEQTAALHSDPSTFEGWLADILARPGNPNGVTFSSVHRVKGMEWDRVLVFRADDGLMPHRLSDDVEEERRVFHVAITRGIEAVTILADVGRPSPFLDEMGRPGSPPPSPAPTPPPKSRSPVQGISTPEEQDLLARLKDWRRETAAARNWPAYLVLPDKTLEAIALRRPSTMTELAVCPGIGPIKLDLYGEQLLELVALALG